MSNNKKKSISKSTIYISIITGVIILIAIVFLSTKGGSNPESSSNNTNNTTTPVPISVVNEEGDQNETIQTKITIRDIKLGKTIKQVKKTEKKLDDTLDNPASATSEDGYTYLTYKFNPEATPNFFGADVIPTSNTSMLVYVFYLDELIEARIQYGAIGSDAYESIIAHNNKSFGNATYSRAYSNGTKQSWWKTKDTTLDVICQNGSVVAYYRKNN